jgi:hypothetical protein
MLAYKMRVHNEKGLLELGFFAVHAIIKVLKSLKYADKDIAQVRDQI